MISYIIVAEEELQKIKIILTNDLTINTLTFSLPQTHYSVVNSLVTDNTIILGNYFSHHINRKIVMLNLSVVS